jgi:hypothetical protein
MTVERKYAILFAATLLCARKLIELDSDRPSPAKVAAVENAISQAVERLNLSISRSGLPTAKRFCCDHRQGQGTPSTVRCKSTAVDNSS